MSRMMVVAFMRTRSSSAAGVGMSISSMCRELVGAGLVSEYGGGVGEGWTRIACILVSCIVMYELE